MEHGTKDQPSTRSRPRPWVTVLAWAGTVVLATVGVVFGSVGAGIEPDGQFIPCGPPTFGRDDSRWDRRCIAADAGVRTFVICLLVAAAVLLVVAVLSAVKNKRSKQEQGRHRQQLGAAVTASPDDSVRST